MFYSLKILSIEASISAWRVAGSSLNKDKPVGLVDNHLSKPLGGLVKISLKVAASPSGLEWLIFHINSKNIPGIFEAGNQSIPSLDNQGFTVRVIIPEAIGAEGIRLKRMKIEHDNNTLCSHVVDDFLHNIQRSQSFEIVIAVDVILAIAKLDRSWDWIIENHI